MRTAIVWAGVAALGGAGACARVLLDVAVTGRLRRTFPFGTAAVNLSGAFALGVLTGAHVTGDAHLLAGTAVLGSYTTFSTWMLESDRLGRSDRSAASLNLALGVFGGIGAAVVGRALGGAF